MRYTTVIDISENPYVYKNANARLLYLHMCLKSGWHDDDRDCLTVSVRKLAADVGITVSACRHALALLQKHKMLTRTNGVWQLKKWIIDAPPTPRPRKGQVAKATETNKLHEELQKQQAEYQRKLMDAVRVSSREELEAWLAELESGKTLRHHGAQMNANAANIEWLKTIIKNK